MWKGLEAELEGRGYDCEFLTSGSHPDEAFLHKLILEHGFDSKKCVTNLNTSEGLVEKIGSYDAIVACRLHPSIIAYSLQVPTVGIVWNNKVTSFYENIGYPERVVTVDKISAKLIADRLELAMESGVRHDTKFLMSCYEHLFEGIKNILARESNAEAFSFDELVLRFPKYSGSDLAEKISWKIARTYNSYNKALTVSRDRAADIQARKIQYSELLKKYNDLSVKLNNVYELLRQATGFIPVDELGADIKNQKFPIYYNIGRKTRSLENNVASNYRKEMGQIVIRPNSLELIPVNNIIRNDGSATVHDNVFRVQGYRFCGWRLRVAVGEARFLLLENGEYVSKTEYNAKTHGACRIFAPGEKFPIQNLYGVANCVAEAVWAPADK